MCVCVCVLVLASVCVCVCVHICWRVSKMSAHTGPAVIQLAVPLTVSTPVAQRRWGRRHSCVHMRARDGFSYQFTGGLYGQLPQLFFSMNILASHKQEAFSRLPRISGQTERAERSRGCASTALPSADIIGGNYRGCHRRRLTDRTRVVKRPIRFPLTTFK